MNRLLVALLAAFDAVLAAAVGLALALAPLTLLWLFGFGLDAPWEALWPSAGTVWQLGHLVPLQLTLPREYTVPMGIDEASASFALSLAPLAFATFTAIFAARSGGRSALAGAWPIGVGTGAVVFAALSATIALTAGNTVAVALPWQAILFPALVFAVPLLCNAVATAWRDGDGGAIDAVRRMTDRLGSAWGDVPGLVVRGAAIVVTGLVGLGALVVGIAVIAGGSRIIGLFQAGQADLLGATVLTIGQLAYLPTIIVWAIAFIAGPGFALGEGTAVSPAGTQLGVVPGIPVLGIVPESTTTWMLLLTLLPVGLGALAGWVARRELVRDAAEDGADHEPMGARIVTALGIAALAGGVAAALAAAAGGALGPGTLAVVGPAAGPVALAVGVETLIGAAIVLLAPHTQDREDAGERGTPHERAAGITGSGWGRGADAPAGPSAAAPDFAAAPVLSAVASMPEAQWSASAERAGRQSAPWAAAPEGPAGETAEVDADAETVEVPTSWMLTDRAEDEVGADAETLEVPSSWMLSDRAGDDPGDQDEPRDPDSTP